LISQKLIGANFETSEYCSAGQLLPHHKVAKTRNTQPNTPFLTTETHHFSPWASPEFSFLEKSISTFSQPRFSTANPQGSRSVLNPQAPTDSSSQHSAHKEWESLSEIAHTIEPKTRSRQEFIEECKSGAFDNVVAAYRTFQSVDITGLIDEELLALLPKSLKFIAHNGMNLQMPNIGESARRGRFGRIGTDVCK